jgi:hypothetical protein
MKVNDLTGAIIGAAISRTPLLLQLPDSFCFDPKTSRCL